ncbi:hypothetical protein L198_06427 [Cryptococcus wingfieldii CBS 7118]|uniref:Uncharacterized protein n=1 Tax=Cryptococcus wingfieldii CBS 7118 TaxID=1295528 RepID=A0A1E3IMA1_9TREE|nr:hypothetical protein L198_06427 [Cryptococcus wingfieldii CBS 7118]ODN89733.1 hypothetical protein L198_06427 [Cryptococcus wingfieldii CBS 7118]
MPATNGLGTVRSLKFPPACRYAADTLDFAAPSLTPDEYETVKQHGDWTGFMQSHELKPWDHDDIDEAHEIVKDDDDQDPVYEVRYDDGEEAEVGTFGQDYAEGDGGDDGYVPGDSGDFVDGEDHDDYHDGGVVDDYPEDYDQGYDYGDDDGGDSFDQDYDEDYDSGYD